MSEAYRYQQWKDIQIRGQAIHKWFQEYFRDSAVLCPGQAWTESDIKKSLMFLEKIISIAPVKLRPSFIEHSVLTGLFFRVLMEEYLQKIESMTQQEKESLLNKVQVAGYLHDAGKVVVPGEYFFENVLTDRAARRWGVNPELLEILDPVIQEIGLGKKVATIDDLTIFQRLHRIADNFGKFDDKGNLFSLQEFKAYFARLFQTYSPSDHQEKLEEAILKRPWKLSRFALSKLLHGGVAETSQALTLSCLDWFITQTGTSLEEIQKRVMIMYKKYQERVNLIIITYFPAEKRMMRREVRELLQIPNLQYVIFDAGNVLIRDPGDELWKSVEKSLNSLPGFSDYHREKFKDLIDSTKMDDLIARTMNNSLGYSEFLTEFYREIDYPRPKEDQEAAKIFFHPDLYNPIPGMQGLVNELRLRGLSIGVLSDCSNFVVPAVKQRLYELYPWIPQQNVLFSSEILSAKRDRDTRAFAIACERLNIQDPRTALFIDDKYDYILKASDAFLETYHFSSEDKIGALKEFLWSQAVFV